MALEEVRKPIMPRKLPPRLQSYNEMPEWFKDNEYILDHYRPVPSKSFKTNFKSIFKIHNETMNIWTHGLLLFPFSIRMVYYFSTYLTVLAVWIKDRQEKELELSGRELRNLEANTMNTAMVLGDPSSNFIMAYMYFTLVWMAAGSFSFHTQMPHSHKIFDRFAVLDYIGVILMINGGLSSYIFFTSGDAPFSRSIYLSIHGILSFISIFFLIHPKCSKPEYLKFRTCMFLAVGLSYSVPVSHMLYRRSFVYAFKHLYLTEFILACSSVMIGAVLYAKRIPEIFWPGKFDLLGSSHNIMHVFVIICAFLLIYIIESLFLDYSEGLI